MIKAVSNKKLELSEQEFDYLKEIQGVFGADCLDNAFRSDKHGIITAVTPAPDKPIHMASLFFLLNVMMNQKLRKIDIGLERISKIEERLKILEERKSET